MFNWSKKKEDTQETEYSIIWYKEMMSGNKKFYTQPFRTKVKAKNYEEAERKVTDFALSKMKLILVREEDFNKKDLSAFDKFFNDISKQMDELFGKFKDIK